MMKTFLIKTGAFGILVMATILICGTLIKSYEPDYFQSIIDKHKRLEQIPAPRIILAGGSSLTFGVDSKRIESEFGKPVVNLSLIASLGMEFIINELSSVMREGDVVILSTEYFLSDQGDYQVKNRV